MLEWADYDEAYAFCQTCFDNVLDCNESIISYYDNAQDAIDVNDVKLAVQYLIGARNYFLSAHRYAFAYRFFYNPPSGVLACFYHFPAGGDPFELTMQKIIDTMWDSNKLESFHFVSYIDAMRASIWNISIVEEHLHEWYRHFFE